MPRKVGDIARWRRRCGKGVVRDASGHPRNRRQFGPCHTPRADGSRPRTDIPGLTALAAHPTEWMTYFPVGGDFNAAEGQRGSRTRSMARRLRPPAT